MNISCTLVVTASISLNASLFAGAPPGGSVKDMALREAMTCDANHNGRIDASEMSQVRIAQSKNPKSYLYLFDLNEDKYLDDSELSKIKGASAKPPHKRKR